MKARLAKEILQNEILEILAIHVVDGAIQEETFDDVAKQITDFMSGEYDLSVDFKISTVNKIP